MSFTAYIMAVERVETPPQSHRRPRRRGHPLPVVEGNAVAAWVARVDPSATRATKDVDVLVRRADINAVTASLSALGFQRLDLRDLVMFIDPEEPSKRSGVHLVWAGERVRPSYAAPAPGVEESVRDPQGFSVLSLAALVRMKLTSFRPIDQAHVIDMREVGLIDAHIRASLPEALAKRLAKLELAGD